MKIFLIDDDELSIFLTQHILRLEGYKNIQTFLSATEALKYLVNSNLAEIPDVILLDLNMPVMTGWDFLDALTPYQTKLQGKCDIYILTSSLDVADTVKSKEYALVCDLLHKPISPEDILLISQKCKERS